MNNNVLNGLVLAGGQSRRMGHDKALLNRDGRSQLAFVVDLLESHVDAVYVSSRKDQRDDEERRNFRLILDAYDDLGPMAGILTALEQFPDTDWLVVACDLPNIDDGTIGHLIENHDKTRPFTAFVSSHDELPEPLCAIYNADCVDIVRGYVEENMKCPRKMLIRSDTHLLEQPNPAALDNVNTPDDLAQSILEKRA